MNHRLGAILAVSSAFGLVGVFGACGDSASTPPPTTDADASEAGPDALVAPDSGANDAAVDANTDGGCGDTTSSVKNCGACGHDCFAGTCTAGVCNSFKLTSSTADWLDADETTVYYLSSGADPRTLNSLAITGGNPVELGSGFNPFQMGTTTKSVLAFGGTQQLTALAKDGSSAKVPVALTGMTAGINSIIAGNGKYATMVTPGDAFRIVDEKTSTVSTFTGGLSFFAFPLVGTSAAYVLGASTTLITVALPPPADGALPAAQTLAFSFLRCALGGANNALLVCATDANTVVSVPLATPTIAPTVIRAPADVPVWPSSGYPRAFAADATSVWWYEGSNDSIVRCSLGAGACTPSVVAPGVGASALLTLTSKLVIYSDAAKGEIRAVAK